MKNRFELRGPQTPITGLPNSSILLELCATKDATVKMYKAVTSMREDMKQLVEEIKVIAEAIKENNTAVIDTCKQMKEAQDRMGVLEKRGNKLSDELTRILAVMGETDGDGEVL